MKLLGQPSRNNALATEEEDVEEEVRLEPGIYLSEIFREELEVLLQDLQLPFIQFLSIVLAH